MVFLLTLGTTVKKSSASADDKETIDHLRKQVESQETEIKALKEQRKVMDPEVEKAVKLITSNKIWEQNRHISRLHDEALGTTRELGATVDEKLQKVDEQLQKVLIALADTAIKAQNDDKELEGELDQLSTTVEDNKKVQDVTAENHKKTATLADNANKNVNKLSARVTQLEKNARGTASSSSQAQTAKSSQPSPATQGSASDAPNKRRRSASPVAEPDEAAGRARGPIGHHPGSTRPYIPRGQRPAFGESRRPPR